VPKLFKLLRITIILNIYSDHGCRTLHQPSQLLLKLQALFYANNFKRSEEADSPTPLPEEDNPNSQRRERYRENKFFTIPVSSHQFLLSVTRLYSCPKYKLHV